MLPDLLLFGIDPYGARTLLNDIAGRMRTGERPSDGSRIEKVSNMPLEFRQVPPEVAARYVKCMIAHFGSELPDVMQVAWPDPKGRFPGERGYDRSYDQAQPRLWRVGNATKSGPRHCVGRGPEGGSERRVIASRHGA